MKEAHVHGPISISFYVFVLYFVKTTDALERTLRRQPLPVCLAIEPKSRNFFKSLLKLLTFQPLSDNSRINILAPNFLSKCELPPPLIAA